MKSFIIRLLINAIAIAVTITLVPGINYAGGIGGLLGLAFIRWPMQLFEQIEFCDINLVPNHRMP